MTAEAASSQDAKSELLTHLLTRRSTPCVGLAAPGPNEAEMQDILTAASRVPDHKKLVPWRFIRFDEEACKAMGALLAERWKVLNPDANERRLEMERERFLRTPEVVAIVASPVAHESVPKIEQLLCVGAVCMNFVHAAYGAGYSAQWLTEWYAFDEVVLETLGLREGEEIAGFMYIGTPEAPTTERPRPDLNEIVTHWKA